MIARSERPTSRPSINLGPVDRCASILFGGAIAAGGLLRGSAGGLVIGLFGAGLLWRGMTGRCRAYESLGISTAEKVTPGLGPLSEGESPGRPAPRMGLDVVEQASMESFPASDSPAWTRG